MFKEGENIPKDLGETDGVVNEGVRGFDEDFREAGKNLDKEIEKSRKKLGMGRTRRSGAKEKVVFKGKTEEEAEKAGFEVHQDENNPNYFGITIGENVKLAFKPNTGIFVKEKLMETLYPNAIESGASTGSQKIVEFAQVPQDEFKKAEGRINELDEELIEPGRTSL